MNTNNLINWFQKNKRDFPWRKNKNPYRVWISEIMLQQTQTQTVLPYFNKWISTYPTISQLAQASEENVLKLWQGLGYYHRVKNILKTSIILHESKKKIPNTYDELLKLPGIGDYSANAILAFAFNKDAYVVDGNIERVISRYYAIKENLKNKAGKDKIKKILKKNLKPKQSSLLNESLMELGATICTPTNPLCEICVFNKQCKAFNKQLVNDIPKVTKRTKSINLYRIILLIENDQKEFVIKKIKNQNLFNGLWEFYHEEFLKKSLFNSFIKELNKNKEYIFIKKFSHHYTKYKVMCHVFSIQSSSKIQSYSQEWEWININKIKKNYPITTISKKSIDHL